MRWEDVKIVLHGVGKVCNYTAKDFVWVGKGETV